MNRRQFLQVSKLLGISLAAPTALSFCNSHSNSTIATNFSGTVLIIRAGAAGMATGYLLAQQV